MMGAISLLPFPFSLLIQKSRLSTLANAGALNTSSGVASGQADPFTTSTLKSKNFLFALSKYYLSELYRFALLGPHSLPVPDNYTTF